MFKSAMADEKKMPPRCCDAALPGSTVKAVLSEMEQKQFIKSVLQYATPSEDRIFCPNSKCGDFIPTKNRKVSKKRPFVIDCKKCKTDICQSCKGYAHPFGQDCPSVSIRFFAPCRYFLFCFQGRDKVLPGVNIVFDSDISQDWELDAVLQLGDDKAWRRCYSCRNLASSAAGSTYMTWYVHRSFRQMRG
jgi:IBR domain, a half RING-finger domain